MSRNFSKIMIIDDEEKLLNAIEKYLLTQQFNTISCKSGNEGLKQLKKHKIDLLIIDILMSDMNGYDFINELEKDPEISHIPFIFLTAKGMTEDRIKGYKMGCKAYLGKPFDPEELVAIIDNILSDKKNVKNIISIKNEIRRVRKKIFNLNENEYPTNFTIRETDILIAVSKGLTNKDIAHNLNISVRNVENYITRLLSKTKLTNRVKLANYVTFLQKGE